MKRIDRTANFQHTLVALGDSAADGKVTYTLDTESFKTARDSICLPTRAGLPRVNLSPSIGVSTIADGADRAEVFVQGENCASIQLQLNVLDDNPEVIAVCEKHNLAAINRGPLAMGLLSGKYTASSKPSIDDVRGEKSPEWMKYFKNGSPSPEWMKKMEAVQEILKSGGRTVAQGALAWIWARSEQTLPIPGFRTVAQVEENCAALQFGPLTAEQMKEIEILLKR